MICEVHNNVAVMFCEIANFNQILNSEGLKSVEILDSLYRYYDKLCTLHGIQKIEVIFLYNLFYKIFF